MTTEVTEVAETDERLPLEMYAGKRVIITYKHTMTGALVENLEGTVDTAQPNMLLVKPKGKQNGELILAENIEKIALDDSKLTDIKQRILKDVTLSTVRGHLADRHGWTLADVNGDLDEEAAMRAHRDLDHSGLSHSHTEIAVAEQEADGEEPDEDELDEDLEDEDDGED